MHRGWASRGVILLGAMVVGRVARRHMRRVT